MKLIIQDVLNLDKQLGNNTKYIIHRYRIKIILKKNKNCSCWKASGCLG